MGSIKVRNLLLSKKLKRSETRLLIVDDNQIRYNEILEIFKAHQHTVQSLLLDDIKTFEKQLNQTWDLIIFGRAYDIRIEQTLALIQATAQVEVPVILLEPENYTQDQYQSFIHRGIYEVVNLSQPELFYIHAIRALSFSRTLQSQHYLMADLESAKIQQQEAVIEQNKAVAVIHEGIHTQANAEYLALFGLKDENDIIGLPVLDILQPKDLNDFKNRFKKISNGQFEFGRFEINTLNPHAQTNNPLKLEFLLGPDDDGLQIAIECHSAQQNTSLQALNPAASEPSVLHKIQRYVKNQPAKVNALVVFSLASCPDAILSSEWNTFKAYFSELSKFIKDQTSGTVFKIESALYATVLQAESEDILNSRLTGLLSLEKPQLIDILGQAFHLNLKLGYSIFNADRLNENNFISLIETAYNTRLPKHTLNTSLELEELNVPSIPAVQPQATHSGLTLEPLEFTPSTEVPVAASSIDIPSIIEPVTATESPILTHIEKALDKGEILLKYQQLYDKEDSNLNTYEVTSGFIYENQWKKLSNLSELDQNPALSAKVDRWILVEACKQLHNFITQYPEAKLIINLNRHALLSDPQLYSLVSKLITIIGSKEEFPIILQFNEADILNHLVEAKKSLKVLTEHGAKIAIRNFGLSPSSHTLLQEIELACVKLHDEFTDRICNDLTLESVQELMHQFSEIQAVEFILPNLNDMSTFASAWNVEARLLQGDYFQKILDHLTDVQDQ